MSNFHCLESSCVTVKYQLYEEPFIKYQYPGEEVQKINGHGLSYSLEKETGQCYGIYQAHGTFLNQINNKHLNTLTCGQSFNWYTDAGAISNWIPGKIINVEFLPATNGGLQYVKFYSERENETITTKTLLLRVDFIDPYSDATSSSFAAFQDSCTEKIVSNPRGSNYQLTHFVRLDAEEDDCGTCTFKIFQNGEIIFNRTSDICPDVEQQDCHLSDKVYEIQIEKTPYLSVIEIIDYAKDAEKVSGVPYPLPTVNPIPESCWNIYRNEIFDFFPEGDLTAENQPVFGDFIAQICSVPDCPRPEYEVICDCSESCPDGTCAEVCGSSICCYDAATGEAVAEIPLSSFLPENTRGAGS